jgi:hypothetical protein
MDIIQKDKVPGADRMIRTLLILVVAVTIRDGYTGELGWFWNLMMLAVTIALLILKVLLFSKRKVFVRFRQAIFVWIA